MAQRKRKAQPKTGGLKPFYIVLGTIAVIGVALIAYAAARRGGSMATQPIDMSAMTNVSEIYATATPEVLGQPDAPIKVVAFVDYECPHCAEFENEIVPQLKQRFVDSGQMQIVYYDFPLGGAFKYSFLAARAARCAGDQGHFPEFQNRLFQQQSQWALSSSQRAVASKFVDFAKDLNLDTTAFESCLQSDRFADVVSANRRLGEELGVASTPTVIVNGKQVQNFMDVDEIVKAAGLDTAAVAQE